MKSFTFSFKRWCGAQKTAWLQKWGHCLKPYPDRQLRMLNFQYKQGRNTTQNLPNALDGCRHFATHKTSRGSKVEVQGEKSLFCSSFLPVCLAKMWSSTHIFTYFNINSVVKLYIIVLFSCPILRLVRERSWTSLRVTSK